MLSTLLLVANENLTAGNAIIAVSLLLFTLMRNLRNRVARTSAMVLACVAVAYVCDSFIALGPDHAAHEIASRLQWLGIAFIPAAIFHLSDVLLATTGLPSRGRRRRTVRVLYTVGAGFLLAAAFGDALVQFQPSPAGLSSQPGALFLLYLLYFVLASGFAFYNVQRARKRCLTRSSARRMAYLQIAFLTPALGIFPYAVLLPPDAESSLLGLLLVNAANVITLLMLFFLSYPLYFFGSDIPDRLVKKQLLDFLLRGPATGLIALATIQFTAQATRILSLPGQVFTPPAVVAVVMLWQWFVSLAQPLLEKLVIYRDDDAAQIRMLQTLSDRVLPPSDLRQLIVATTEAICDKLRIERAFVVNQALEQPEFVSKVGKIVFPENELTEDKRLFAQFAQGSDSKPPRLPWRDFVLLPLYSRRSGDNGTQSLAIGVLGLEQPADSDGDAAARDESLLPFISRLETSLDDMRLQSEITHWLEGLLPQFQMTRSRASQLEYRQAQALPSPEQSLPERSELFEQVRAALRHYWGGPGITQSNLLKWQSVQQLMAQEQESPVNALRQVLSRAIDSLQPQGDRKMTSPEWTLFNILQLRFLENRKVREVARRLSMSEADLYRKQRVAIQAITDILLEQERMLRGEAS